MFEHIFISGALPPNSISGSFDPILVFTSYFVASAGAYIALALATYIFNAPTLREKQMLHWVGAFALGSGIWSMHFIGMLAYRIDMVMHYDPGLTALSMLIAIVTAYGVLQITRASEFTISHLLQGSVLLGLCICAMHYTGMAAMDMRAEIRYISWLFCLSIAIAIAASGAALWIVFSLGRLSSHYQILWRTLGALLIGAAVCGMHYTGVEATVIVPFPDCRFDPNQSFNGLAIAVIVITGIIFTIAFALLAWSVHRRNLALLEEKVSLRTAELEQTLIQLREANLKAERSSEELEASLHKAEAANIAKSSFLANMSHELRTPMNGVLGMAYLLSDTELSDEQQAYVSTINASAESLLMLLNDILDFSKIEADALVLEHIAFDIKDTLARTADMFRVQALQKKLDLNVECSQEIPAFVWGDPGRIRQIVTNLISNAIKFTETGFVHMTAGIRRNNDGDMLYIEVEDSGTGIPMAKRADIFEKFTQADASITRKYGGTGLGLAISKQLVAMMGGAIGVESIEGKGSTFWFSIPCQEADASDAAHYIEPYSSNAGEKPTLPVSEAKVLLVEDYHVNHVFAEKLLRKFGVVHIDSAEDGQQAVDKLRTKHYDMVFMDCQMPVMDGYQATAEIRAMEDGSHRHTPIIAMTANAMIGDREKCLQAGMDDYLSKPLRAHHLKRTLQSWFAMDERKAARSPAGDHHAVNTAPVDMAQLHLFTNGDPVEEKALAVLFIDQAESMLHALAASTDSTTKDAWKSAAHRLKGSSGNMGATRLYELCKRAEIELDATPHRKNEIVETVREEIARIRHFFGV